MTSEDQLRLRNLTISGILVGSLYALIEYFMKVGSDDEQEFIPLLIRAMMAGGCILLSVGLFETFSKRAFRKRPFIYLVVVRSVVYVIMISIWLILMNWIWYVIKGTHPSGEELALYLRNDMYLVNLFTIMIAVIVAVGMSAINSLHRKGELASFILGRYHTPREVDRIFCFIDLKESTAVAERLGHQRYATFLRDYFSDITEALRKTSADIYQYVGDEIVLVWSYQRGLRDQNAVRCFFLMQEVLAVKKQYYLDTYGVEPAFRGGVHAGKVVVTWVGELKREIVYIGDVVNTAARIREDCKRTGSDFLASGDLLEMIGPLRDFHATFIEETVPRGKAKAVRLFQLERNG